MDKFLTAGMFLAFFVGSTLHANATDDEKGNASWYANKFHGRRTASGQVFNQTAMTAAHKSLPFGTLVRVTHLATGNSVIVRINDRGPFVRGRVIDLSKTAATELGLLRHPAREVAIEVIEYPEATPRNEFAREDMVLVNNETALNAAPNADVADGDNDHTSPSTSLVSESVQSVRGGRASHHAKASRHSRHTTGRTKVAKARARHSKAPKRARRG